MRNRRNYYRILQVQPDAPEAVIRSSYRALMLRVGVHPDRGGDTAEAALLNEAYRVLSNCDRRLAYDRTLEDSRRDAGRGAAAREDRGRQAYADLATAPARNAAPPAVLATCPYCETPSPGGFRGESTLCDACGGPLATGTPEAFARSGNRTVSRLEDRRAARCRVGWPAFRSFPAEFRDVSPGGGRLVCAEPLAVGDVVGIEAGPLRATGRVVRRDRDAVGGRWVLGLRFLSLAVAPGALVSREG